MTCCVLVLARIEVWKEEAAARVTSPLLELVTKLALSSVPQILVLKLIKALKGVGTVPQILVLKSIKALKGVGTLDWHGQVVERLLPGVVFAKSNLRLIQVDSLPSMRKIGEMIETTKMSEVVSTFGMSVALLEVLEHPQVRF